MPALHDMGGNTEFFGPIVPEPNEPVFHSRWEGRVFGISGFLLALFGQNIDAFRYEMEQLPRDDYLSNYYRRWLAAFEAKLVRAGYLGPQEIDARVQGGRVELGTRRVSRLRLAVTARVQRLLLRPTLPPRVCKHVLPRVIGTARPALRSRRFSVGDRIRVRSRRDSGHTRQPGYVSGKAGLVTAHHGATLFPDAHAIGRRARPQHLYTVAFDGEELWGADAEEGTEVRVDLFEAYLEPG